MLCLKLSYTISSLAFLCQLQVLRLPALFPVILLLMVLFGAFGLGSLPLFMELGVEETFPLDPVYSEVTLHLPAQVADISVCPPPPSQLYGFLLVVLGNVLPWAREGGQHQCGEEITPLDYTPFFYFLMAEVAWGSLTLPCCHPDHPVHLPPALQCQPQVSQDQHRREKT